MLFSLHVSSKHYEVSHSFFSILISAILMLLSHFISQCADCFLPLVLSQVQAFIVSEL